MDSANKRIAKNTLYMYVRLFTVMVIGLYTSRLVLNLLGVSDYGLFAVVGGVLGMFTFISSSLAGATSRFFNTEMGKQGGDLNASFCINLLLHFCLAILILALAETVGLWYVYHYLNVAPGKLGDAVFVYQLSIFTACLGIVNSPYQSLFNAHERFKFMAILDIVNSLVRLGCILMLTLYHGSYTLRLYSLIFSLTTVNTFVVYHYVAHRDWAYIIRYRLVRGWHRYKEVLNFGSWNLLATLSYMARSSGSDLVLNSFFGTSVNGAFAISKSVRQYTEELATKFDGASAPQIIQSYAAGDKARYMYLANKIGRVNILLFELIAFPLLMELEFVLHLWLGKVPNGAVEFTFLNVLVGGMSLTCGGIYNVINASGKIKWFKINLSFFFLLCVPLGWLLFRLGYPAYSMLFLFLLADVIQRGVQLVLAKRILDFDSWSYVREAYMRPLLIAAVMAVLLYMRTKIDLDSNWLHILIIIVSILLSSALIYMMGITTGERQKICKKFKYYMS